MWKKNLLITICKSLLPYWSLAEWFLFLVQESEDEEFISQLYKLFLSQIKTIKSEQAKETLKTTIQKLKEKEEILHRKEEEEAEKLFDDLLDTIEA